MSNEQALRLGIVGPRRVRQGLGPYFALHAESLGAILVGTASSSPQSARAAAKELKARLGHPISAHVGAESLCASEALDALIIASPQKFHEEALHAALSRSIPCLVEKPLLWEGPGTAARVAALTKAFQNKAVPLWVHCQWPETLPAYYQLFPGRSETLPQREFRMRLSPTSFGLGMLPDSLPHLLSLCQALLPGETCHVSEPKLSFEGEGALKLSFHFHGSSASWPCLFELRPVPDPPRPAGYGWDGDFATREIELPAYKQYFSSGKKRVFVPDPLLSLLKAFFDSIQKPKLGKILPDPTNRAKMMETLILAASKTWQKETQ